ncbi:DNA translocase FtsK [Sporanaerobacter acetigenes]|uniref:DNA segregation ATPase FtsK/SpoIIIE, S-DNA-T family n=1 Tax=Sporanaerobacter acetigenes DSM 13106 TaxID=1123281 RepID=A0A1M5XKJ6_9FIRM|nr:DNA segregation ATPase FtsK/SpoIIIE, S-DNA-T family [Sporanaerobacter acetigenes DSM 13106]
MKSKKKKKSFDREIVGIIIISFGILLLLSLFTNKTGVVGNFLKDALLLLMGFGGYIFPLIILAIGLLLVLNKLDMEDDKKSIFLIVIFICFITIIDIKDIKVDLFKSKMELVFEYSQLGHGGGIVGGLLGYAFFKLFGSLGSYIILSIISFIFFLLLTEIRLTELTPKFNSVKIENNNEKRKKRKEKYTKVDDKKKSIKILDYSSNDIENENSKIDNSDDKISINKNNISIDNYQFPPIELLKDRNEKSDIDDKKEILVNAKKIEDTMKNFGIAANIVQISKGPTITCYELQPAPGVKVSRIVNLSDDIALNLATSDVRIEAPIPGKAAVGIEVPNKTKLNVGLKEILLSEEYMEINSNIPLALGKNVAGKPVITTMEKMPHLLIAGATGSGKSVCINTIIMSILYKSNPDDVKLILIDPKVVELSIYNDIPHLLIPVVTDAKKARSALNWAVEEMTRRYKLFAQNSVRDIYSYNNKIRDNDKAENLSQIVIIIDELADLMMVAAQEIEDYICRLAQMARAAGMYLIVATQRPSVDIITGTIKANIPSRISFAVTSQVDSRTILDMSGAEKLLGKGDMLFYPSDMPKPIRVQGAFIDDEEVEEIVSFLKKQNTPTYNEEILDTIENENFISDESSDELLPKAIDLVINEGQASISLLQRKLKIGYARAARLIDEMEDRGIVGGYEGSKPRKVLVDKEDFNS